MRLIHGRNEIELHELQAAEGLPLLLLHELGGSASQWQPDGFEAWPGPVYALDFAGHGSSDHLKGGGYYPEYFLADADLALSAIGSKGECAVVGAGIGGYVAMLLAGSRRAKVSAALLLPGRGLAGGGLLPDWENRKFTNLEEWDASIAACAEPYLPETDPMVASCENDIRPEPYVADFAAAARRLILDDGIAQGDDTPAWWYLATRLPTSTTIPNTPATSITPSPRTELAAALSALRHACNEENAQ
jgi:pimeloyl-ACP methyl ester carboxylesterase